ncbi:hypothetical protein NL676_000309 [Syzygium grande]|nr:hypothetical protein NL676_000309 [Syzygium grande]
MPAGARVLTGSGLGSGSGRGKSYRWSDSECCSTIGAKAAEGRKEEEEEDEDDGDARPSTIARARSGGGGGSDGWDRGRYCFPPELNFGWLGNGAVSLCHQMVLQLQRDYGEHEVQEISRLAPPSAIATGRVTVDFTFKVEGQGQAPNLEVCRLHVCLHQESSLDLEVLHHPCSSMINDSESYSNTVMLQNCRGQAFKFGCDHGSCDT